MSNVTLFHSPLSPSSRTAFITAKEISLEEGVDYELRIIDFLAMDNRNPEFLKVNPLGKVPALSDDGFFVDDSHAIAIYLVEKFAANDSLYPKDLKQRTMVNKRLFFEASYLFQRMFEVLMPLYRAQHTEVPKEQITEVEKAYGFIEGFFDSGDSYVAGNQFTIADISIWTNLASLKYWVPIDGSKFPKLTSWLELLSTRKTAEINDKGAEEHLRFVKSFNSGEINMAELMKKYETLSTS